MKKIIFLFFLLGLAALFYFYEPVDWVKGQWFAFKKLPTQEFSLKTSKGETKLSLEVADSSQERTRGLMYRTKLAEGSGMWFVFEDETPRTFWMKNTKIPLDVIFFDKNKRAVSVVENLLPCLEKLPENCMRYSSKKAAAYALEVNKGFAKEHVVKIGNEIKSL